MLPTNFTIYGTAHVGLPFTSPYKLSTMVGPCKYGIASGYFTYVFASLDRELARWIWGYTPAQRLEILNRKFQHDDVELEFKGRYDPVASEHDIETWLRTSPAAPQRPKYGSWYCTFVFVDQRWATFGQRWLISRMEYFDGRIEWEEEREWGDPCFGAVSYLQDWWGVPVFGFVSRGRGALVSAGQVYGAGVAFDEASDDG